MRRLTPLTLFLALLLTIAGCSHWRLQSKESLVKWGDELQIKGEFDAAIIAYRNALKKDSSYGLAYERIAGALLRMGAVRQAREQLVRAVEFQPHNRQVLTQLTELTYRIFYADPVRPNDLLHNLEDYSTRMIEKWPDQPEGYRMRAQVHMELRHTEAATILLEEGLTKLPGEPSLRTQLASVRFGAESFDAAESLLREVLADSPEYDSAYDLLYLQLMERSQPDKAVQVLEQKLTAHPSLNAYMQLAAHEDASGRRDAAEEILLKASSAFSTGEDTELRIGDFWMNRAEYVRARGWFDLGRKAHPALRAAYAARITSLLLAQQNPAGAKTFVEASLKEDPNSSILEAHRSVIQLASPLAAERTKARGALEMIAMRMPNSAFVRQHLGHAYLSAGDLPRATEQLERAVALDPYYAQGWVSLAEANYLQGNIGLAKARLKTVLAQSPRYGPAVVLSAKTAISEGKPREAEELLSWYLSANPMDTEAMLTLGSAKLELNQTAQAMEYLTKAQVASPNDPRPVLLMAKTLFKMADKRAAMKQLVEQVSRFPDNAELRSMLALTALKAGEDTLALAEYRKLATTHPTNLEYRLGLANVLALNGHRDQAAGEYKLVQQNSGRNPKAWLLFGALMWASGDWKQAQQAYQEALQRDGSNPFALNNLAYLLARSGQDLQSALNYAQRAKQTLPRSSEVCDTLAYIYVTLGMKKNAAATMEEMIEYVPASDKAKTQRMLEQIGKGELPAVKVAMEQGRAQIRM